MWAESAVLLPKKRDTVPTLGMVGIEPLGNLRRIAVKVAAHLYPPDCLSAESLATVDRLIWIG